MAALDARFRPRVHWSLVNSTAAAVVVRSSVHVARSGLVSRAASHVAQHVHVVPRGGVHPEAAGRAHRRGDWRPGALVAQHEPRARRRQTGYLLDQTRPPAAHPPDCTAPPALSYPHPLFCVCRTEILVDILRNCEYSRRPPDDVIIRQGELGDTYACN